MQNRLESYFFFEITCKRNAKLLACTAAFIENKAALPKFSCASLAAGLNDAKKSVPDQRTQRRIKTKHQSKCQL